VKGGPQEVVHSALCAPGTGEVLAETSVSDQWKMAVLLQGAGVLCLVTEAGWRLREPWEGALVDAEGLLRGLCAEPGRDDLLPQVRLRALALELFGGESAVAGRGQARRSARLLLDRWRQEVEPVTPARAVAQVLEAAGFLWTQPFGAARAAALLGARIYDRWKVPWAAGPAAFRSRLAARCADRGSMQRALAGPQARELWEPEMARREPYELASAGRWTAAVRAWERRGTAKADERLAFADALHALGRWQDALGALRGLRSPAARVLRLDCLLRLGRLAGARRALGGLEKARLPGPLLVETTELAVRVLTNLGDSAEAGRWVERTLRRAGAETGPRAHLVAAGSAWDRRDLEAMRHHLDAAGPQPEDAASAWRWHLARALAAELEEDGETMVEELAAALSHRRALRRFEAAGLWNELGLGRALCGDLAGAERAFLHALRLQEETQGPRRTTLALYNLAEIRLRRGRLRGVREILDRSRAENREAGNRRGLRQDAELEVRYELVTGRPREALERCRSLREGVGTGGPVWRQAELAALEARALGWLGEPAAARRVLEEGGAEGLVALEPEERPAVWALAGERARALAAAHGPTRALWSRLLTGGSTTEEWECLETLEPYRAARLVYDVQGVSPGQVPAVHLRRAAVELRRVGALRPAETLEALDAGPWRALEAYLGDGDEPATRPGELLHAVAPGARLVRCRAGVEEVLVDGPGGISRLEIPFAGGRLELCSATAEGPAVRAVLSLIARELSPWPEESLGTEPAAPVPGIVGRSPELLRALERTEKLAAAPLPLLVLGETGTGKELFARRAHDVGPRAGGPFVPVNCAELSESLLLSELFGHVRGAFTGADRDRAGIFETARDGTVFLDEIGDLPLTAQSKLLRVLQEGEVRRVGESLSRRVDVRVVAATHRDLAAMVREGAFREDLFFRLQTASIELPPLRRRGEDLWLLTDHFLRRLAPGRDLRLTGSARARLEAHPWPGNVRELRGTLAVAVALAGGDEIGDGHLELPVSEARPPGGSYHEQVEALRRRLVRDALEAAGGNRAEAARRLGLSRQALSYLVRELGLYVP
jgi:DNA-binding NtrC family response regulator/tetratricopeptide (TPR) repeat protein